MQRTRTRTSLLALATAAVAVLAGVALPATSASAMAVDCSYVKGLGKYVDSYGVTCAGSSSSSAGSQAATPGLGAGPKGPCEFQEPELPEYAQNAVYGYKSTSRTYTVNDYTGKTTYRVTKYYDYRGRLSATKTHVKNGRGDEESYFSDLNPAHAGIEVHSHWSCDLDNWGDPSFSSMFPDYTDVDGPRVTTDLPAPRMISALASTSTLTPAPGSSDQFVYRVELTSKTPSPLSQITIDVDLSEFEVSRVMSMPTGGTCSSVYKTQECDVPDLAPGASSALTLLVKLRPTSMLATAGITSTASFKGVFPRAPRPVGAIFHLGTRATAVPTPGPAKPACDLGMNVDGVPVTVENVDTATTTTLTTHCLNDLRQDMAARAEHGTVSIDGYGTLKYTPADGYVGSDTVTVTASTATAVGEPSSFDVNVVPAAVAVDDHYTVTTGSTLEPEAGLLANDSVPITAGWLIQQGQTPPAHGTLELDTHTGHFVYTPASGFVGSDSFKYRLSGRSGTYSQVVTVTIDVTN